MKKSFPRIFWILIVGIIVLGVLRFASPEDTRICEDGQRIMHGNPDVAMPTEACATSGEIDLTNCISYFDGCNNCSVKDGKPDACTLMYCETPAEPKCNEYASGTTNNVGLANPASTNCVNKGGKLEIVDTTWWQVGMCTLSDGKVCEERAYMRGECKPTNSEQWTTNNDWIPIACTEEAKMCDDGSAVGRTGPNCEFAPCPDEEPTACTMQYDPVCASVAVQCIKAPCPAIEQTFGNECMMKANKLAKFLYKGECKK